MATPPRDVPSTQAAVDEDEVDGIMIQAVGDSPIARPTASSNQAGSVAPAASHQASQLAANDVPLGAGSVPMEDVLDAVEDDFASDDEEDPPNVQ